MATATPVALAAKSATTTIPTVMVSAGDPVAAGLVVSLARPAGNITGLSALATELNTKRLEVLKDAVPQARPSWTSAADGSQQLSKRLPTERAQSRGSVTELEIGGDRG